MGGERSQEATRGRGDPRVSPAARRSFIHRSRIGGGDEAGY